MQWFYSHCLKIILQFVDVSKLVNVILLVFLAFLYSLQKHTVKSSSLLAPHQSLLWGSLLRPFFCRVQGVHLAPTKVQSIGGKMNPRGDEGECGWRVTSFVKLKFLLSFVRRYSCHQLLWLRLLSYRRFSSLASGKLFFFTTNWASSWIRNCIT